MNTNEINQMQEALFKDAIQNLGKTAIIMAGKKRQYKPEDMLNVCFIFQEVFMSLMHDEHYPKIGHEGMKRLAEEAGKSIRQTILLFTGIDMHKAAKAEKEQAQ